MTTGPSFPQPDRDVPPEFPRSAAAAAAVRPVAITLVVYNAVSLVSSLLSVVSIAALQSLFDDLAKNEAQFRQFADWVHQPWFIAVHLVGLATTIVALIGSIQMLRMRTYGLAMSGAVMTMINFVGGCCCLIGLGLGIWAMVVLLQDGVSDAFNRP